MFCISMWILLCVGCRVFPIYFHPTDDGIKKNTLSEMSVWWQFVWIFIYIQNLTPLYLKNTRASQVSFVFYSTCQPVRSSFQLYSMYMSAEQHPEIWLLFQTTVWCMPNSTAAIKVKPRKTKVSKVCIHLQLLLSNMLASDSEKFTVCNVFNIFITIAVCSYLLFLLLC